MGRLRAQDHKDQRAFLRDPVVKNETPKGVGEGEMGHGNIASSVPDLIAVVDDS